MADLNTEAVRSLKAINAWVDVIESNIGGTQRVAFKGKKVSMLGSNKYLTGSVATPARAKNDIRDIMLPTAALEVSQVTSDWKQGEIISSTEETHLAILGTGFFVVTDRNDFAGETKTYYTRDGQFTWDSQGYLRTMNGLYVMNASYPPFDPERDAIRTKIAANTDSAVNYFVNKNRVASAGPPPTTAPELDYNGLVDTDKIGLSRFSNNDGLYYTVYGTSYLEESASSGRPIYYNAGQPDVEADVKRYSLESSNGSMVEYIPTLATAQKMFSAVSKIIAVYNSTTDDMNNLVR
jgi:flagellar basal body rod protein FlgG